MPPRRAASTTDATDYDVSYQLGQISGQLRELIHNTNNLQASITAIGIRVAALEASDNRREGATGLAVTILKSPAIGWLVGAAISAWAVLTGRVHL
jgi:hypothetical protein